MLSLGFDFYLVDCDLASTASTGSAGSTDGRGVLNAKAEVFYLEGSSPASFDSLSFLACRQILHLFLSSIRLWFHVSCVLKL